MNSVYPFVKQREQKPVMDTEQTTEGGAVDTQSNGGEGESQVETVSVPKADYDKLNQTLGSLKRELKDLRKTKEEPKETPTTNQPADNALLKQLEDLKQRTEKQSLRQAGITDPEDVELARTTAKKWNVDIDEVLNDEDFKVKLERQQTARANVQATSGVKGGAGGSQAKNTTAYWQAKGTPPTPADVPDRKTRQKIVRDMMQASKQTGRFYNE